MYSTAVFGPDDAELSRVDAEFTRYGVVLHLPFRLRVGGLTRIPPVDGESDVWLFNQIQIPQGTDLHSAINRLPPREASGYEGLWTDAVVVINSPKLVDGALEALRNGDAGKLGLGGNAFRALTALNEVVFGISEVSKSLFGGTHLRLLTDTEFFAGLRLEFALVADRAHVVTDKEIREVFEWRPPREFRSLGPLTGELDDLPRDAVASVSDSIREFRAHAYHELAFRAKTAMVSREPLSALVLACAAFEGVHAHFLRQYLVGVGGTSGQPTEGLIESLLREQGIYTLVQLSATTFLPVAQRPDADAVDRCLKALQKRNDIMHAKQKKGTYRIRQHTFLDLSNSYQAILELYQVFLGSLKPDADEPPSAAPANDR